MVKKECKVLEVRIATGEEEWEPNGALPWVDG